MNAPISSRLFQDAAPDYSNTSFPPPRPFQQSSHEDLRQGFREGHRSQLIMAPTGAGKSYLGHRIAHEALLKNRRVVFLCDRTTLVNQPSAGADAYGLTQHGIIQAGHPRRDSSLPYQIASVQTLAKRGFWPETDVLIVDEAHTMHDAWVDFVANNRKTAVVGLSATPFTKGLGQVFTRLINATTMAELTQSGVLVPMRVLSCTKPDMAGAAVSKSGEWTDKAAEERGMEIIGDVVQEWMAHAENRKTIVFGASIAHCKELCRLFIDAGVMAAVFTSETTAAEREVLVREFSKPDATLHVLISVEALAKGFDVQDVGCVVDCRPLRKSLSTFMQMIGRGLRSSPATGKTDCILLDHSGNILRFAEDFEQVYFNGVESLDMGQKLDKTVRKDEPEYEAKGCPSCGHTPFRKRCMACGFEKPAPAVGVSEAGQMVEITIGKGKNKKVLADNPAHLWGQCCTYARAHSAPDKQDWRARFLYRDIMGGQLPPKAWHISTTPEVPLSAAVASKIKSLTIRNVNRRAA